VHERLQLRRLAFANRFAEHGALATKQAELLVPTDLSVSQWTTVCGAEDRRLGHVVGTERHGDWHGVVLLWDWSSRKINFSVCVNAP
jgi:hypothetical protein